MKLNEALLIGGALLATLVLFKGGAASSNVKAFSGKSAVPVSVSYTHLRAHET